MAINSMAQIIPQQGNPLYQPGAFAAFAALPHRHAPSDALRATMRPGLIAEVLAAANMVGMTRPGTRRAFEPFPAAFVRRAARKTTTMTEILANLLFLGALVGSVLLAIYMCLQPPRLFLRGERWLTEQEFRAAVPGKEWCRHVPAIALVAGFLLHVAFFLFVRATCTNTAALPVGFLPLFFLWIYVPVGAVELLAGVSVLVPVGRGLGGAQFIAAPSALRAGAFRLSATALALTAFLTAAYW
jgi:hypothetical protein